MDVLIKLNIAMLQKSLLEFGQLGCPLVLSCIVVSIVWYAIRIVSCTKKFRTVREYRKCSWIVWYIGAYHMNCIVWYMSFFWLKFMILFDLNKLLDFVNTKLLGNFIESNEIASPWVFFFLPSLSSTKFRLYS